MNPFTCFQPHVLGFHGKEKHRLQLGQTLHFRHCLAINRHCQRFSADILTLNSSQQSVNRTSCFEAISPSSGITTISVPGVAPHSSCPSQDVALPGPGPQTVLPPTHSGCCYPTHPKFQDVPLCAKSILKASEHLYTIFRFLPNQINLY